MKNHTGGNTFKNSSGGSAAPETLLDDEISKLKNFVWARSIRDYTMISLALATGIRNHELVSLTIFCIAPYGSMQSKLDIPGTIAKGGRARTVPLHPDVQSDLEKFLEWKSSSGELVTVNSPLFVSKYAKKMLCERDFQRITQLHSIASLGKSIHPHVFRHTFATRLLQRSNISVVQAALGHVSIQTTQIYLHPSREDLTEAVNKM